MRALLPALLVLLAAACGGDFSNDDIEFLNALPVREELRSNLPAARERTGAGAVEALALGVRSKLYDDTRASSDTFNGGLDGLLQLVEFIRRQRPSERLPDARRWGPFPAEDQPGHDVRFVMQRSGGHFDYSLQFRPRGSGEEGWWPLLTGDFEAAFGVRRGRGHLTLHVAEAVARGLRLGNLAGLSRLEVEYQTEALPSRVHMVLSPAEGTAAPQVDYTYRQLPGGAGEMSFLLLGTDAVPLAGSTALEDVAITSRWTAGGAGRGSVEVLRGDFAGASFEECWDADALTRYERRWDGLVTGSPTACPDLALLAR